MAPWKAGIAAICAALALPVSASAAGWVRISAAEDSSNLSFASLAVDGPNVVAAYKRADTMAAEVTTFSPDPGRGPVVLNRQTPESGWAFLDDPLLLPAAGGGLQLLVGNIHSTTTGDPLNFDSFQLRLPDGSFGPPVPTGIQTSVGTSAVLGSDGQPLWASAEAGALHVYHGTIAAATVDLTPLAPNSNYVPQLAYDHSGRLWLAWAVLGSSPAVSGLYLLQLDPATGNAVGTPQQAPRSNDISNNNPHLALGCTDTCRLVYHEVAPDLILSTPNLLSWGVGDPAPTVVARVANGSAPATRAGLAAAGTADGHLWVAWYNTRSLTFEATFGDRRGAGGIVLPIGRPATPNANDAFAMTALTVGRNLVLTANWFSLPVSGTAGIWARVVVPPDTSGIPNPKIITDPGGIAIVPGGILTSKLRRGCVKVRIQAYVAATDDVSIFTGLRRGRRISSLPVVHFGGPGIKSVCVRLPKRPHAFYRGRRFRYVFGVRLGQHPRPGAHRSTHVRPVRIV